VKDLSDYLRGEGWEEDLATGLFLPPGVVEGELYEVQGGPQHTSNPNPFYFATRKPVEPERIEIRSIGPYIGFEIRGDGSVYRWIDGERVAQRGLDAIRVRAQMRATFGEGIADMAGIEPE
jgi:hypothetical protein